MFSCHLLDRMPLFTVGGPRLVGRKLWSETLVAHPNQSPSTSNFVKRASRTLFHGQRRRAHLVYLERKITGWWLSVPISRGRVTDRAFMQNATHPVFNLTMTHTEAMMAHFYKQTIPSRPKKTWKAIDDRSTQDRVAQGIMWCKISSRNEYWVLSTESYTICIWNFKVKQRMTKLQSSSDRLRQQHIWN